MRTLSLAIAGLSALAAESALATQATFMGLGDLPGGTFSSSALAVSADGSVVVGYSISTSSGGSTEAFRWTAQTGMLGLSTPDNPIYPGEAVGVSADGSRVTGTGAIGPTGVGWLWTAQTGLTDIGDLPGGAVSSEATAISADGSAIVGFGSSDFNPGGEAFRWTEKT